MIILVGNRSIEVPDSVPAAEREAWALAQLDRTRKPQGWRGLGDVVAAATKAVGIRQCGPCRKRQEALNRLVPFANENPPPASQLPAAASGGEKND
jgi:hypothetical protein